MNDSFNEKSERTTRKGLHDMWGSDLYQGAAWSDLDNPLVHTTTATTPKDVISWHDAKHNHAKNKSSLGSDYHINAFIHCYIDDIKFDGEREGIWNNHKRFFDIASHYDGILGIDFSTNADFPEPLKRYQFHRMRVMEHASAMRGFAIIPNARWGTEETWNYCFDALPEKEMLAIGVVGSQLRSLENRPAFEAGIRELVRQKHPSAIIVVGSAKYQIFSELRSQGIKIYQYDGSTSTHFKRKEEDDV